jgi:hypothetical protein
MTRHEELALSLFMPMIWDKSDLLNRGVEWGIHHFWAKPMASWNFQMGVGLRHFKNWSPNLAIENPLQMAF